MLRFSLVVAAIAVLAASGTASSPAAAPDATDEHIARIENGFAPISLGEREAPIKLSLQQIMQVSNVPGLSIAVIDDYRIAWAKGYGVTEAGGKTPVTAHTLFPASSISKPVTALAALMLVERGALALDADVNTELTSWKVPENDYTREQKVTLRRILTHTAGTNVHGFIGYRRGEPIPTLRETLDGANPANNPPIRVDYVPGTRQRYSGGGFVVLQQLMVDATHEAFPDIMQSLVLNELGLRDSTFEQPLPASRAAAAASGHNQDGETVPGKWNVSPEMAVGGLWTTPTDLGKIAIEVALEKRGRSRRLLSPAMARQMLTPQVDPTLPSLDGRTVTMGLGWVHGAESDPARFEHDGVQVGYQARLLMWDDGHGVVVMANNWSFPATVVMRYVVNQVAREYGWTYRVTPYSPWPYADTVILATAKMRGARAAIARYHELKRQWENERLHGPRTVVWASDPPDYPPNQWDLLGIAQTIGDPAHLRDAIEIMNVEVREYPKFPNAYATLGDLYVRSGQKALAIQAYRKLLELVPDSRSAADAIRKLEQP